MRYRANEGFSFQPSGVGNDVIKARLQMNFVFRVERREVIRALTMGLGV